MLQFSKQESSQTQSPDQVSVISAPGAQKSKPLIEYCCAMYDYDAAADDELTFEEGQVIKENIYILLER